MKKIIILLSCISMLSSFSVLAEIKKADNLNSLQKSKIKSESLTNNRKEIFLKTSDNIKIAINHYNSGKRNSVLIICPGWFMCKDANAFKSMSKDFYKHTDVITMDFRGHCKSSGFFTFTAKEVNDLKAVVDYAKTKYSNISLLGFSLGGATSILYTAQYKDIDRIIAVSAPADFNKIEHEYFNKDAYNMTMKKFELWRAVSIRPGNLFLSKIRPIDVIQNISPIPILFLTGTKDPTVYPWHSAKLYNNADKPKALENFEDNYHAEDLYLQSSDKFLRTCINWLDKDN